MFHTLALDSNGQAFSTGCNNYGELGRSTEAKNSLNFEKVNQQSPDGSLC